MILEIHAENLEDDSALKGIGGVEAQHRLAGDPRPSSDTRCDAATVAAENGTLEDCAKYPFLPPGFIQPQLSSVMKAG